MSTSEAVAAAVERLRQRWSELGDADSIQRMADGYAQGDANLMFMVLVSIWEDMQTVLAGLADAQRVETLLEQLSTKGTVVIPRSDGSQDGVAVAFVHPHWLGGERLTASGDTLLAALQALAAQLDGEEKRRT